MKAQIFNIQKFCLHDGPGIRTTVFFKGCNLRCNWCANPESQHMRPQLTLDQQKCLGCGACIDACGNGARTMINERPALNGANCIVCGSCVRRCPAHAIGVEGHEMSLEQVLDEVMKDEAFYRQSGGGVTFSGGEALLQAEFAMQLARELHQRNINVAVETAGAVSADAFVAFMREMDYVFIDLKHYSSERHRAGTGVGNENILRNIRWLRESGLPFTVRIPVIPGYNAAIDDAQCFARLLADMQIYRVQLLPFHQMGERKYSLLGHEYVHASIPQLHREDLLDYQQAFKSFGVHAEF